MSMAVLEKSPVYPVEVLPYSARILITRTMGQLLRDSGLIDERCELIDGEIISRGVQEPPHSYTISLFIEWIVSVFGINCMKSQMPIDPVVPDMEVQAPVPDVVALKVSWETMPDRNPTSHEIALAIEVANTSLEFDMTRKARLYARAGIEEYWIADINSRTIIVHRDPQNGEYTNVTTYTADQTVSCLAYPDKTVVVDTLIVPASPEPAA